MKGVIYVNCKEAILGAVGFWVANSVKKTGLQKQKGVISVSRPVLPFYITFGVIIVTSTRRANKGSMKNRRRSNAAL